MDWAKFKDPVSHTFLAGAVVASWSLTHEVAGLRHFTVMTNIFVTEFDEFSETFRKNSIVLIHSIDHFLVLYISGFNIHKECKILDVYQHIYGKIIEEKKKEINSGFLSILKHKTCRFLN